MRDFLILFRQTPRATRLAVGSGALLGTRSLLGLAEPLVLMVAVNAVTGADVTLAVAAGAALVAVKLTSASIGILARTRLSYAGQRFTFAVRNRLYRHIQMLPAPAQVDDGRAGRLWLLTGDLASLETLFSDVFVRFVPLAISLVGAIVALVVLEPRLAVLAVTVTAGVATLVGRQQAATAADAAGVRDARATLSRELESRLAAMETIQLAGREQIDAARVRAVSFGVLRAEVQFVRQQARGWGGAELLSGGIHGGVILAGAYVASRGALSIGALLAAYMYVGQLLDTATLGAHMLGRLHAALVAARRVGRLFAEPVAVVGGRLQPPPHGPSTLQVENVTFGYETGAPALECVTFAVRAGEHVAVVGRSGSGKTTLVRLIARLRDPLTGRIRLDGYDLRDLDSATLRQRIAVLPQTVALLRGTLADNICFSRRSRLASPVAAARQAGLDERLSGELFTRNVGDDGATLSGGQRQRVALARLFVEDPCLLVLDEPTSALDESTADAVWTSLCSHAQNCTLLAITHDLRLVRRFPRVLVLDRGRLVADGPPAIVLAGTTAIEEHTPIGDGISTGGGSWLTA